MMVGLEADQVLQAQLILEHQGRDQKRIVLEVSDSSMPNVSEKMVRIIQSYTEYVIRVVWKNY